MVVIQMLQVAYNLADTFWLGRYSATAVGAMSLAFPIIFFLISIGGGFTAAGSILVAQYKGAGGDDSAGLIAGQTIGFVTLTAIVLGAVGFLVTGPMLGLLPADPATKAKLVPMAGSYMRVFFLGVPALFGFFVFTSLMRGYGNTRVPLRVMLVSVTLNVVLDPVLIFGWGPFHAYHIQGAAIATVFSRIVAAAIGMYILFGTDAGPAVRFGHLRLRVRHVRDIVRLGVPSALEQSSSSLAMIVLTGMVSTFPPAVVAAYGLGNRLISLVFLPAMGLGQSINTVVGQNLGAGKPDRAERGVWLAAKIVVAVMALVAVVVYLVPGPFVRVFLPADSATAVATIGHASNYLRVTAVMFAFTGLLQIILGGFRGAGNTKTSMTFSLITLWAVRVPATYYLAFVAHMGPIGLWIAVALGDIVGAIAATAWFTRGTWKRSIVETGGRDPVVGTGDEVACVAEPSDD